MHIIIKRRCRNRIRKKARGAVQVTSPPFVLVRFFIFLNDGIHGIPFCFHVRYQFKLCPASVQVVILTVNLKVSISLQIICQKSHTTFEGHDFGSQTQPFDFFFGQFYAEYFNESLCIDIKQIHIALDFIQINLILCTCACTKTD